MGQLNREWVLNPELPYPKGESWVVMLYFVILCIFKIVKQYRDGPWAGFFYSGQRTHRSSWEITTWVEAIHTCRGHRSERTGRLPGSAFSPLLVKNKQMKQKGEWEELE